MPDNRYTPEQVDAMRDHLAHARRRPSCHNACGPRCECECGGTFHQGGLPLAGPIPEEILAEAKAIARGKGRGPRLPRPRRQRRRAAQLCLML